MASTLELHSEAYQLEGGAGGDAARRALGRPRLDRLSVLVREAVQNSWDARCNPTKRSSIDFIARLETVVQSELDVLRRRTFVRTPKDHPLLQQLKAGSLTRLVFDDRGTVGLGGPVFKTRRMDPNEPRNFVRFFRDIGRDPYSAMGGGTYGYGKSVLFNASAAATIIVHTRFANARGTLQERLMGMSLWRPSQDETLTGRHWWGIRDEDHPRSVAPATGAFARDLAHGIGFKGFDRESTGTSIMILAPQIGEGVDANLELDAKRIAETMVLWYWPRMLGGGDDSGRIKFKVFVDRKPIPVPDPETSPPFNIYSAALRNLVQRRGRGQEPAEPNRVYEIRSERPQARLGWLSLGLATRQHRFDWAVTTIEDHPLADQLREDLGFTARSSHVALLRSPGQVIRYLKTPAYLDARIEYAGVFFLDPDSQEVEDEFINSEPPSHDDWRPPFLGRNARSYVRIGLNRIRAESDRFVEAGRAAISSGSQDALGQVSADLGQLLSAPGTGARATGKSSAGERHGGGGRGKFRVDLDDGRLDMVAGARTFILPFRIEGEIPDKGARLVANPRVIVAGGGIERDAPADALLPRIIGWQRQGAADKIIKSSELKLKPSDNGEWELLVSVPSDAMIGVAIAPSTD